MLNKPINPYPYHKSIDVSEPFELSCEIDYNKNLDVEFTIYDKNTGDLALNRSGEKDGHTLKGDIEVGTRYVKASKEYDETKTYYTRSGDKEPYTYTEYNYSEGTWDDVYSTLYTIEDEISNGNDYMWQATYANIINEDVCKKHVVYNAYDGTTGNNIQKYTRGENRIDIHAPSVIEGLSGTTHSNSNEIFIYRDLVEINAVEGEDKMWNDMYDMWQQGEITHVYFKGYTQGFYKISSIKRNTYTGSSVSYYYFYVYLSRESANGDFKSGYGVQLFFFNYENIFPNIYDIAKICDKYYRIDDYEYNSITDNCLSLYLNTGLLDEVYDGDIIILYPQADIEYQQTPYYYFRARTSPEFQIKEIDNSQAELPYYTFIGSYFQNEHIDLDYVQFKLKLFDKESNNYVDIASSDKIYDLNYISDTDSYEFAYSFYGLVSGKKYEISLTAYDSEESVLVADSRFFDVAYDTQDANLISFSKENNSIKIDLSEVIPTDASTVWVKAFRYDCDRDILSLVTDLEVVSGGISVFDTLYDYNVSSGKTYKYIIETMSDGISNLITTNTIKPEFQSTSLIGLSRLNNKHTPIEFWNFSLSDTTELNDVTYELTRNYTNGFGKYKSVSKGNLNSASSSYSYFLGSIVKGEYYEPVDLSRRWNDFINDDTIKLLRTLDGEIAIISIDSAPIKKIRNGAEIARVVNFSYTQIGDTEGSRIYEAKLERR